jgi:hypothetical protein
MATLVSDELEWAVDQIVHHLDYKSAVLSGIKPDPRHLDNGGFHCSIDDLKAHGNGGDYSNTRPSDHGFNPKYGAAFDVSMSKADMIKAYGRIHAVWADHSDPRRRYVNAINCWDGSGDAVRLDFDKNTATRASNDHTWHDHGEVHREYVRDAKALRAVVSIFKGESKAAWIAREERPTESTPAKPQGVTMAVVTGKLPELKRGMSGKVAGYNYISRVQMLLGIKADNDFGPATEAKVAAYNRDVLKRSSKIVDGTFWKRIYALQ